MKKLFNLKARTQECATVVKSLYCKALEKYQAIKASKTARVLCTVGLRVWKVLHWAILMVEVHEVWFYLGIFLKGLFHFLK
jgi:hypothetical protein